MNITKLKEYAKSNNVTVVKRGTQYEIYHNDNPSEIETCQDKSDILNKIHSSIFYAKAGVLFN